MLAGLAIGFFLALLGVGGLARALQLTMDLRMKTDLSDSQRRKMGAKALFYFVAQFFALGGGLFVAIQYEINPLWMGIGLPAGALLMVLWVAKKQNQRQDFPGA